MSITKDNIPIGKKVFANYKDDYNDLQINFIVTYIVTEISDDSNKPNEIYLCTKNNMVGTHKGMYFPIKQLTGSDQINVKYLSNIHEG